MNSTQYQWLVAVLVLALLSILTLQAVYTVDNYRIKTTELAEEVDQLFAEAVQEEVQLRRDSVQRWLRSYISDTSKIILTVEYNAEEGQLFNSIQDRDQPDPYTTISFSDDNRTINKLDSANREITIDLITKYATNYLAKNSIYYWTPKIGEEMIQLTDSMTVDISQLHQIFQEKLQTYRISSRYQLRSIPIDSTLSIPIGKSIYTEALPTGLTGDKSKTFAEFANPFSTILRRARWSILGSLLIILLTASSFFIMLRIILRQKQLAQIKDDFIDNISHELQTPIATLRAANEGLEKYHLSEASEKAKQYLSISRQQINRLSQMVDQTLWNSIYERKSIQIQAEQTDLKELIENCLAGFQLKHPEVVFHFKDQLITPLVQIDPTHLKSCLENLLDNAIKHNSQQEDLQIYLLTRITDTNHLEIQVKDNGKGIPLAEQGRIFEKFYRVDDRKANGYGIGLFYVKSALQTMNGSISLDSKPEQGAQFTLKIPLSHA